MVECIFCFKRVRLQMIMHQEHKLHYCPKCNFPYDDHDLDIVGKGKLRKRMVN